MFSTTVAVLHVPFHRLQMMIIPRDKAQYRASSSTNSILVWFCEPESSHSSALSHLMMTSPMSTCTYSSQLTCSPVILPKLALSSCLSSSSLSSKPTLISCFTDTFIFKRDKTLVDVSNDKNDRRANNEITALDEFPRWKTPFVVTAAFRAFYVKPPSQSSTSSSAKALLLSLTITDVQRSPDKRLQSSSSSSSSCSLREELSRERRGVILERCVGSLHDGIQTDYIFTKDMTIDPAVVCGNAFTWQYTYHHSESTIEQKAKRSLFDDLCRCTCQRLIAELRNIYTLYHHFHHLAHCVLYIHERGVVHGDIKLQNILIRVVECTHNSVESIQLLLADFDCASAYKRDVSHHLGSYALPAALGTLGFHPSVYCSSIPYTSVAFDYLSDQHRPTHREFNDIDTAYYSEHPFAHPYIDIFSLGIVFLSMIHRCDLGIVWYFHIKYEMSKCRTYPFDDPSSPHRCTPAHVLLHHPLTHVNPTLAKHRRGSYDLYTVLSAERNSKGLQDYAAVIQMRASKIIGDDVYELLEMMTMNDSTKTVRLTLHDCIQALSKCINNARK